jgi:tetratricopeptide (TPR) repeat protein
MIPTGRSRMPPAEATARPRSAACLIGLLALAGCAGGFAPPSAPTPADVPALEARVRGAPDDLGAAARLGAAYRSADRLDDARRVLESVLARDPEHPIATYFLGVTYEELAADSSALALYTRYAATGGDARLREAVERRAELVRRRLLQAEVRASLSRDAELADTPARAGTVAVFPFLVFGSDESLRPLGRALAEMLTTDLGQTDRLVVVERLRAQLLVDEMGLAEQGMVDPTTAARGGRLIGASRIVQGRIDTSGEGVTVEARVAGGDPDAPESGGPVGGSDALERFFDLEKRLAVDIYAALGVQLTAAERERVTRNRTENLQALLAFGLGLESQDAGRYQEAQDHFQRAATLDPSFGPARVELQRSERLTAAVDIDLDALADLGANLFAGLEGDPLLAIEALLPGLLDRNPAAEFLGNEGLGADPTLLEIIIRRPGGTP